ncbi:GerW family sporulation protein [Natroniella sp. ANB-PHB2]|uniref:GerW family sporulation protein n=1 Tax=Natroniella sp. ANB-PHB2 TaxID=3384444 RepID=UPI0038D4C1A6
MPLEFSSDLNFALDELITNEQIIGQPTQVADMLLVPVSDLIIGAGVGTGAKARLAGGGGGVYLMPKAIIIISSDQEVSLLPLGVDESGEEVEGLVPKVLGEVEELIGNS